MALPSMYMKQWLAYLVVLVCVACLVRESNARPPWLGPRGDVFTSSIACANDEELLDLCQRCAKLTKSRRAYPACCSADLDARKWCADYIYFGESS